MKIDLKFITRFLLVVAFCFVGASFFFALNGLQYSSDYVALWGGVIALLSGLVDHKREIIELKKKVRK